jgi:hypothetical protein
MTHGFSEMIKIMSQNMFHVPVPLLEKVLRPAIVYLFLIVFLRLFGKRELAQLNPFDLVVLLSLSNTVQNAMIGDDNSVSGGVVGAFTEAECCAAGQAGDADYRRQGRRGRDEAGDDEPGGPDRRAEPQRLQRPGGGGDLRSRAEWDVLCKGTQPQRR